MANEDEPEEVEFEQPDAKTDKTTIVGVVKEVLAELGITSSPAAEPVEGTNEIEEIETPRQQESRMRREVESAIGALHIHVGGEEKKEKPAKAEKQETEPPGRKPFLQRVIGLD